MPEISMANSVQGSVSHYYSEVLKKTDDLKTNACKTSGRPPQHIIDAINKVSPEVNAKYYGCGLCIPEELEGRTVLDLGCGSGRDVYIASQFVGENGHVIGVDMTKDQIDVAIAGEEFNKCTNNLSNTTFKHGYIEKLSELGIEKNSVDVIISNCVINLSPDKFSVLKGAYDLLKPGGELYFSDVYADRRVPQNLRENKELWGECISGALYWNDFVGMAKKAGFLDPRLVSDSVITVDNPHLEKLCGNIKFFSATYRLFKIPDLETHCEDYGQAVIYNGGMERSEFSFKLDDHHEIETGKVFGVCGNTWKMLHDTRFKKFFTFIGDFSTHYGIYDGCGTSLPFASAKNEGAGGGGGGGGGCC